MHTQYTVICTQSEQPIDLPLLLVKLIDAGLEVSQITVEAGTDGLMRLADAKTALTLSVQSLKPVQLLAEKNWVVFSPTEAGFGDGAGYWSAVEGWVTADLASVFPESTQQTLDGVALPEAAADDASWVPIETFAVTPDTLFDDANEYRLVLEFDEDKDHRVEEVLTAASPDAAEASAMETYRNARVVAMYQRIR